MPIYFINSRFIECRPSINYNTVNHVLIKINVFYKTFRNVKCNIGNSNIKKSMEKE